ncbi:DUF4785 domain-containing protein [Microbulbifer marinus]|uniref:DUF4785 domain-containing protein n=1 Tax=Microbulbifer marinus TaxID=658218 RepID=A0A1H3WYP8_9GAMM|nr:DUF4785 domain-containing protein [Microbulbifer marinus]SDZ91358.1 protein of unknown function [Microbulbifer marinus]
MKSILITTVLAFCAFTSVASAQEILNNSREQIHFSQYVDPADEQRLADTGSNEKSRVFFRRVSGAELNRGVELVIDAKKAVIQISPLDRSSNGKRVVNAEIPRGMTLSNGTERRRVDDDSIALYRKSQGLRENFPDFYGRAHVMRVPEEMGRGKFTLQANGNAKSDAEYIVYVLDKHSDIALEVQTPSKRFARSGKLVLDAKPSGNTAVKLESISTTLIAPNGERYAVDGNMSGNSYNVDWPITADAPSVPGELWRIEVRSTLRNARNEPIERVAVLAADVFTKTAGVSAVDSGAQNLQLSLSVQHAGRYEARALVFGRDSAGEYKPVLLAYQAQWLDAGQREMQVPIDQVKLAASGLHGPYQVRNIQLLDQGRMSVLEYLDGSWELK